MIRAWRVYTRMIKLSHTLFALPFTGVSLLLTIGAGIAVAIADIVLMILAFAGLRSAAMSFNRIADAGIDAKNPRTAGREIPAGLLSLRSAWIFLGLSLVVFLLSVALLHPLAWWGAIPALVLLAGYSYSKRFTWLCHLWLGFSIALSVPAVPVALGLWPSADIWIMYASLALYIAGFDILYAIQDHDFDRRNGLKSIPARFGIPAARITSACLHLLSLGGLITTGIRLGFGITYWVGIVVIGALFSTEHIILGLHTTRTDRIPMAFFHVNAAISLVLFLFTLSDYLIRFYQ